jgi:hypothetical protein
MGRNKDSGRFHGTKGSGQGSLMGGESSQKEKENEANKEGRFHIDLQLFAKMPNSAKALVAPEKISRYLFNVDNPIGKNKAKVFKAALGYDLATGDDFIKAISEAIVGKDYVAHEITPWGEQYKIDVSIKGPNGATKVVRTTWMIDNGSDKPRFITAYVKKEK